MTEHGLVKSVRRETMKWKLLNILSRWKHPEGCSEEKQYDGGKGSPFLDSPKTDTSIPQGFENTMGQSQVIRDFLKQSGRAAGSDCHILLTAEPGTEKDLLAYLIHEKSPRRFQPFVKIDCTRQASDFLDGATHYYQPGSMLGPARPLADQLTLLEHGTLFLDEVDALSRDQQTKLLSLLLHHESSTSHGRSAKFPGIRIIASTRRDLRWDVATKMFRADLFYRLNVIPLRIPPAPRPTRGYSDSHQSFHEKTCKQTREDDAWR